MARTLHHFALPEILFLRKFFNAVDHAVSREMDTANVAYEEYLSPVLGRLLDKGSPFQSLLDYSIKDLNADLDQCGSGNRIRIEFETNEHAKGFSGKTSHADLGIVLRMDNPFSGKTVEKAILVECKRLYPTRNTYTVHCRYEGFDTSQFKSLSKIALDHHWDAVYYFLYNPTGKSFDKPSESMVRAFENQLAAQDLWLPYGISLLDSELLYHLSRRGLRHGWYSSSSDPDPVKVRDALSKWVSRRPGLKVLGLTSLKQIVESNKRVFPSKLTLSHCYAYAMTDDWTHRSGSVPFVSFATFMVDFFMSCARGCREESLRKMAQGVAPDGNRPDESKREVPNTVLGVCPSNNCTASNGMV